MKKYILTPVTQKNHTLYSMVADPREIVTAVKRAEAEEAQENQRPWSKKKVLEIVEYVMGRLTLDKQKFSVNELIPNAPIINLIGKFEILYDGDSPYILFPETEEEQAALWNSARNADMEYVPGVTYTVTLDGFIISDNIECLSYENVNTGYSYSDHDPVKVEFMLK